MKAKEQKDAKAQLGPGRGRKRKASAEPDEAAVPSGSQITLVAGPPCMQACCAICLFRYFAAAS